MVHWKNKTQEVWDTGSELTLRARNPEHSHDPFIGTGVFGSQEMNGELTKVWLMVGPLDLWIHTWSADHFSRSWVDRVGS